MINMKSEGGAKHDSQCFLFSLKTLTKYPVSDADNATYFENKRGPWFGDG